MKYTGRFFGIISFLFISVACAVDSYVVTPGTSGDALLWHAVGGFFDDTASLLVPRVAADAVLNCAFTGGALSFIYSPDSDDSSWYTTGNQLKISYTGQTGQWANVNNNTAWRYNYSNVTWEQIIGGNDVWGYSGLNGCWVFGAGTLAEVSWRWEEQTGVWRHIDSDSTWRYNFLTNVWDAVYNPSLVTLSFKPPLPLVQQVYIAMVYKTFFAAGMLHQDMSNNWSITLIQPGVYRAINQDQTFTGTYNTTRSSFQLNFHNQSSYGLTDSAFRCIYDAYTGAFNVSSYVDRSFVQSWIFNYALDNNWRNLQTGENWSYEPLLKTWFQGEDAWRYSDLSELWYLNESMYGWQFKADTGLWYHDDGEREWHWRYLWFADRWQQLTTHDGFPEGGLPPLPVVQKTVIDIVFNQYRLAGVLDSGAGLFGWQSFMSVNGDWVMSNSDSSYQVLYDKQLSALIVSGVTEHQSYSYFLNSGSWQWRNTIDSDDNFIAAYDAITGNWYTNQSQEPVWNYQQSSAIWTRIANPITWVRINNNQWVSSETNVTWEYSYTAGTWRELAHESVWQYEVAGRYWQWISGDGSSITGEADFPPLPLVQQHYLQGAVYAAAAKAEDFFVPARLQYDFASFDEDRAYAYRANLNGAFIEVDFAPAEGDPTVHYVRNDDSQEWLFNLATHDFSWSNTYGDNDYTVTFNLERDWGTGDTAGWEYDLAKQRWRNVLLQHEWIYEPSSRVWANLTNNSAFIINDRSDQWVQVYGATSAIVPPKAVVQVSVIAAIIDAIYYAGLIPFNSDIHDNSFIFQNDGTWQLSLTDAMAKINLALWPYQTTLASSISGPVKEVVEFKTSMIGGFSLRNNTNLLRPKNYGYDVTTHVWQNTEYDDTDSWAYVAENNSWHQVSTPSNVWQYYPSVHSWNAPNNDTWLYDYDSGQWHYNQGEIGWVYDFVSDDWYADSYEYETPSLFPPLVILAATLQQQLLRKAVTAGVFNNSPLVTWQSDDRSWKGADDYSSGTAEYDVQRIYPYYWADALGRNQCSYNNTTGDWRWSFTHEQLMIESRSTYDSVRKYWSEETRSNNGWYYRLVNGAYCWISQEDATVVWRKQSTNSWFDEKYNRLWTYTPGTGVWEDSSTEWLYNFAHQQWYSLELDVLAPLLFPPLPLLQQLFLQTMVAGATDFFNQPLYAAAHETTSFFRHPLYGSRPLRKGGLYDRYNAGAILVNAPLTLDGVWLVHNDVARNLGKLQLPRLDERALPSIIGGERASCEGVISGPPIFLFDSHLACHESLVLAGVRLVVTERPEGAASSIIEDANNRSSIVTYQRGRELDAPLRRGPVVQLGSVANMMADGSQTASILLNDLGQLTSSSLRDSFIDIYRSQEVAAASEVSPVKIELALRSASEVGVSPASRATRNLFLAHDARMSIGWPTPYGSSSYFPWNIPLTAAQSSEDEDVFILDKRGNGSLHIGGASWCITGRDGNNNPPSYPVTGSDRPGVVYVDYGGLVTTKKNADLVLDTVMAVRMSNQESAGSVTIPADQLELSPHGRVQGYGPNFASNSGNIAVSTGGSNFALGRPFQASTIQLVKGRHKRRK